MRIISVISLIILSICCLSKMQAQDTLKVNTPKKSVYGNDSLNFLIDQDPVSVTKVITDTISPASKSLGKDFNKEAFKPNPTKAVIYSAIFPGLGQIYNKKYWKLPIVYGGFLGLSYAISWNGRYYNDYSDAYKAIMSDDPRSPENSAVWLPFFGSNVDLSTITDADIVRYQTSFKNKKNYYRRYRDLSIIGTVALYALCMIDAYVDAQLFDFDISPDLSFRVVPAVISTDRLSSQSLGVQLSLNF